MTPPLPTAAPSVQVNGAARHLSADSTLLDLIVEITGHELRADGSRADGKRLGVAAAIDSVVVPRSQWAARMLTSGNDIEIVTAVQGG